MTEKKERDEQEKGRKEKVWEGEMERIKGVIKEKSSREGRKKKKRRREGKKYERNHT